MIVPDSAGETMPDNSADRRDAWRHAVWIYAVFMLAAAIVGGALFDTSVHRLGRIPLAAPLIQLDIAVRGALFASILGLSRRRLAALSFRGAVVLGGAAAAADLLVSVVGIVTGLEDVTYAATLPLSGIAFAVVTAAAPLFAAKVAPQEEAEDERVVEEPAASSLSKLRRFALSPRCALAAAVVVVVGGLVWGDSSPDYDWPSLGDFAYRAGALALWHVLFGVGLFALAFRRGALGARRAQAFLAVVAVLYFFAPANGDARVALAVRRAEAKRIEFVAEFDRARAAGLVAADEFSSFAGPGLREFFTPPPRRGPAPSYDSEETRLRRLVTEIGDVGAVVRPGYVLFVTKWTSRGKEGVAWVRPGQSAPRPKDDVYRGHSCEDVKRVSGRWRLVTID